MGEPKPGHSENIVLQQKDLLISDQQPVQWFDQMVNRIDVTLDGKQKVDMEFGTRPRIVRYAYLRVFLLTTVPKSRHIKG